MDNKTLWRSPKRKRAEAAGRPELSKPLVTSYAWHGLAPANQSRPVFATWQRNGPKSVNESAGSELERDDKCIASELGSTLGGKWRKPAETIAANEGGQPTCGAVMKPSGLRRCGRVSKELATNGSGWNRESRMLVVFGVSGPG